jgi:PKD repeat protein
VPIPSSQFSRLWNFGTSTTTGLTASKTYTSSGVYSVTLTVTGTGTNNCSSKISKQILVFQPPAVNFTVPPFCSKDTITATNQSVSQSGFISSYNWKLNNTYFSSVQNPTLTASAGTYSVKLIVSNTFNCKDSLTKPITVLSLPNVDFTTNLTSYYYINSPINFIPNITNANSYLWNITSIPTSTIQSPTVSFNTEGSYTISLNLQDQQGCKNSKTKTITVSKHYLDLAVLNVKTVKDNDGFITVEADIANYGSVPVTSFDIHYQISDAGNIKETWNGILNPNAFYVYTFNAKSATQKNKSNNITCVEIEKANTIIDENINNNTICNTLNIDEISVSNPLPNPTDSDITLPIILNNDMDFTIAIYNSTGQRVYEETTQKGTTGLNFITLPTSVYSRGCYIIKTAIDGKIFIKKFIISK